MSKMNGSDTGGKRINEDVEAVDKRAGNGREELSHKKEAVLHVKCYGRSRTTAEGGKEDNNPIMFDNIVTFLCTDPTCMLVCNEFPCFNTNCHQ